MSTFSAIDVGRTGVGFARYWMDSLAHDMANVNTVRGPGEEPFRARLVVAQALGRGAPAATASAGPAGGGVAVRAVVENGADPARVYDPAHALADDDGYVTMPVVDLAGAFSDLIIANRAYQANLRTIETGREAYQSALRLGQR